MNENYFHYWNYGNLENTTHPVITENPPHQTNPYKRHEEEIDGRYAVINSPLRSLPILMYVQIVFHNSSPSLSPLPIDASPNNNRPLQSNN